MSAINWNPYNPNNWLIDRVKNWFYIGRGRVISNQDLVENGIYPVYSSQTLNNGIMGYINTYDFNGNYITWTTDGVYAGTIFLRNGKFNCTNVCGTLLAKKEIHYPYASYYLQYASEIYKRPDTNGAKIMNNEMAEIRLLIPPLETQVEISDYLDEKVSAIDGLIDETEKSIENLKEYKINLITETIYNFNKTLRKEKLKYYVDLKKGLSITKADLILDGIPVISYGQIHAKINNGITMKKEMIRYVSENYLKTDRACLLKYGDYIFADTSEDLPGVGNFVLNDYEESIFAGYHSIIASPKKEFNRKFLAYEFLTNKWREQLVILCNGTRSFSITQKILNEAYIVLPDIQTQNEIVEYLDKKCKVIEELIEVKQKKIETLKEYKKSLIYECVTGKKVI